MSLSIGIVGLPNVGKSTLFNALTDNDILAANYPFATIDPNTGIVPVPDERLAELQKLYNAAKVIPATVTFVDIAGLVAGANKGEGLGNQFLANIRECDAIVHVVRAFSDGDVVHVSDTLNPKADIEVIQTELALADIQTIDKIIPRLAKSAKANPSVKDEIKALETIKLHLEQAKPLPKDLPDITEIKQLLSAKPVLYVFNVDEETLGNSAKKAELQALVEPARAIFVCATLEDELKKLAVSEQVELLQSYGQNQPGLHQLITGAYELLGLQSYLTAGPKEVRAWTIKKGASAPQAAGVIHGDFERGFIAAQVVNYQDLMTAGSEQAAKAAGKVRTEGKTYVMQPDDIVEFRFNVSK